MRAAYWLSMLRLSAIWRPRSTTSESAVSATSLCHRFQDDIRYVCNCCRFGSIASSSPAGSTVAPTGPATNILAAVMLAHPCGGLLSTYTPARTTAHLWTSGVVRDSDSDTSLL